MWVKYRDGREELQEVKYNSELAGNDKSAIRSQEQIKREETWCKTNNIDFVVRTDKNISNGRFFLDNANVIAARLRHYIPNEDKYYNPYIINTLENHKKLTIEELIENNFLPINNEITHLCYMYEKGMIDLNINDKPLNFKTEVTLCQN